MYTNLIISLVIITFSYWFTLQMRNKHFSYNALLDLQRVLFPLKYIVLDELGGVLVTNVIYELARLEIADIIKSQGGKMNICVIAKITGTDEDKLNCLLCFAMSKGFFHILDNGVYANNSISLALKQMTSFAKSHNGLEFYEWLSLPENKGRQEIFSKAINEQDSSSEKGLNQDYDWSQYCNTTFVDFASGIGSYLFQLMTHYPAMKGVLYELPSVIEMSEKLWSINHKQLLNRVQFVRADFFINPPPPADIYFLRSILHNWPDEKAIEILKTVRSAISLTNVNSETTSYFKPKLLIAERIIDDNTPSIIYQVDIMMMFMANGKERTKPEIEKLLDKSGWKFTKITSCRGGFSVIEAVPI
ncbi:hydroxyneurosporene methyltransferase [Gigaspora margarita]|uniref:Hydroxyneurosporene methyltransferase n=1 Tax=Gigaspora margarita TaxID=4874 RepID=A0A8H4AI74_GIGMA|nr:hydroxyneurosporene methyltransferase [Gigaspora margarita]